VKYSRPALVSYKHHGSIVLKLHRYLLLIWTSSDNAVYTYSVICKYERSGFRSLYLKWQDLKKDCSFRYCKNRYNTPEKELPITEKELPITEMELPITDKELPITEKELPISQNQTTQCSLYFKKTPKH